MSSPGEDKNAQTSRHQGGLFLCPEFDVENQVLDYIGRIGDLQAASRTANDDIRLAEEEWKIAIKRGRRGSFADTVDQDVNGIIISSSLPENIRLFNAIFEAREIERLRRQMADFNEARTMISRTAWNISNILSYSLLMDHEYNIGLSSYKLISGPCRSRCLSLYGDELKPTTLIGWDGYADEQRFRLADLDDNISFICDIMLQGWLYIEPVPE